MGRLLDALRAHCETPSPAKVANLRMSSPPRAERFADSQDSQRAAVENEITAADASSDAIRSRLLALAASEGLPASAGATVPADELHLYAGLDDGSLFYCVWLRTGCPDCAHHHQEPEGVAE